SARAIGTPVSDASGLQAVGVHFDPPTGAVHITMEQAIKAAGASLGPALASQATGIAAQYTLFSDDQRQATDAQCNRYRKFRRVLAWVVIFEGLNLPNHGPSGRPLRYNHEGYVLIDATKGEYMEAFSFR